MTSYVSTNGGEFGDLLRAFRRRRGLSQNELAERSGVAARAIGALENSERRAPHRDTVSRLSHALELAVEERDRFERSALSARVRMPRRSDAISVAASTWRVPTVGRDRELAELRSVVARHRLITLTGFGGVGKSRVALDLARRVRAAGGATAVVVDCSIVANAGDLIRGIARGLHARLDPLGPVDALLDELAASARLLVLDNCEAAAEIVRDLARAVMSHRPDVTLVVTSRQRLMLSSEFVYRVDPLATRDAPGSGSISPAAQLLLACERAMGTARESETSDIGDVETMCAALDGIPLFIEMAAAGFPGRAAIDVVSLHNLDCDAASRHASAGASFDWSFALLDEPERTALTRLSQLDGEFEVAAVDAVCARTILAALVEKSLVNVSDPNGRTIRYGLFRATRALARKKVESAEPARESLVEQRDVLDAQSR